MAFANPLRFSKLDRESGGQPLCHAVGDTRSPVMDVSFGVVARSCLVNAIASSAADGRRRTQKGVWLFEDEAMVLRGDNARAISFRVRGLRRFNCAEDGSTPFTTPMSYDMKPSTAACKLFFLCYQNDTNSACVASTSNKFGLPLRAPGGTPSKSKTPAGFFASFARGDRVYSTQDSK